VVSHDPISVLHVTVDSEPRPVLASPPHVLAVLEQAALGVAARERVHLRQPLLGDRISAFLRSGSPCSGLAGIGTRHEIDSNISLVIITQL
jgi:hypothetical protein